MNKWLYGIIGLVTFVGFLIYAAPASILLLLIREEAARAVPDLAIGEASGSIWRGQTTLQYAEFPVVTTTWQLRFLPLITGKAVINTVLDAPGLSARLNGTFNPSGGRLHAPFVTLDSSFINRVSAARGMSLSGEFNAEDITAEFDQRWIHQLSGHINWPGGLVHIQTPQQYYSAQLPPLVGTLSANRSSESSAQTDVLGFSIDDAERHLARIEVDRNGWARVDVTYDFMNLAGLPVAGADAENGQASAILIEEKIL